MMKYTVYNEDEIADFLKFTKIMETQNSKNMKKLLSVQNKIPILSGIDPLDIQAIIYDLKFLKVQHLESIVKEGDNTREIFFILSGECGVFVKNNQVNTLKKGDSFGESASIFQTQRDATVVCTSEEVTLLSFSIDHDNLEFCAVALAKMYKNLAFQINAKLEKMNSN